MYNPIIGNYSIAIANGQTVGNQKRVLGGLLGTGRIAVTVKNNTNQSVTLKFYNVHGTDEFGITDNAGTSVSVVVAAGAKITTTITGIVADEVKIIATAASAITPASTVDVFLNELQ